MKRLASICCLLVGVTSAVPVAEDVLITDVSPCGFRLIWHVGEAAFPSAEVFSNAAGTVPANDAVIDDYAGIGDYDQVLLSQSGVMNVEVCGLLPDTQYWVRGTATSLGDSSTSDTPLLSVRTAVASQPFAAAASPVPMINPPIRFTCLGEDGRAGAATGWLVATIQGARSPISGPVTDDPTVYLETSNLISDATGLTLDLAGGEPMTLQFYRGLGEVDTYSLFAPSGSGLGETRDPWLSAEPLEAPRLLARPGPDGPARVLMEFPVTPGEYYRIESSPSLTSGSWVLRVRDIRSPDGRIFFDDHGLEDTAPPPADAPRRFYRVVPRP